MPRGIKKNSPQRRPLADRFWEKVDVRGPDECWPWLAGTTDKGYGEIAAGGHCGRMLRAHRVAWSEVNGPIPPGMDICHSCDNPPCCNPTHLFPGTNARNMADKMAKGRNVALSGDSHGSAKLTAAQVEEIRQAVGTQQEIADRFGISQVNVSCIRRGKTWRTELKETQQERAPWK